MTKAYEGSDLFHSEVSSLSSRRKLFQSQRQLFRVCKLRYRRGTVFSPPLPPLTSFAFVLPRSLKQIIQVRRYLCGLAFLNQDYKIYGNRSLVYLKKQKYPEAIADADACIQLNKVRIFPSCQMVRPGFFLRSMTPFPPGGGGRYQHTACCCTKP